MLKLTEKFAKEIARQPETGMGYWTGDVALQDGRIIKDVVVVDGAITKVRGQEKILLAYPTLSQ